MFLLIIFILGLVYFAPGKKNPKIVVDDYDFCINKKVGQKTRWRCTQYSKTKCCCFLLTFGNSVVIYRSHNHMPTVLWDYTQLHGQQVILYRK